MKWLLMCWKIFDFLLGDQSAAAIKQGHKAKGHKKSQYAVVLFDLLLLLLCPKRYQNGGPLKYNDLAGQFLNIKKEEGKMVLCRTFMC